MYCLLALLGEDNFRWVVGLGWYAPEKISGAPKGLLR